MRNLIAALLCVIMITTTFLPIYAITGNEILSDIAEEHEEEQTKVKQAVESSCSSWSNYLGTYAPDIDFHLMYQCYNLEDHDIVSAFKKNGNFRDNILDSYIWVVPNYGKGGEVEVVAIENSEFGWKIRAGQRLRKYPDHTNIDMEYFYDRIFDEFPNADAESFRVIKCSDYNCRFIYFTADNIEYLTPYFYSDDPEWAKSGEIYTAENIIAKITENYNIGSERSNSGFIGFVKNNVDYIILGSAVLLAGVVVAGIVIKRKNRKIEDE